MMKAAGMVVEDSMSNLTSGSNDASISSGNRVEIGAVSVYPQRQPSLASSPTSQSTQPASKKKRNLPGNPDPEAEVIALSPRTLLATNRFICEICNKGFKRDQNLQLHRRGHNLPWKLKKRSNKELAVIRKKVYVCPETTCVHHDPSRALGDLTGVKKHFSRKHGEKKWKCEKCSKRYAVQSDWKAHSKICGTREYRCDCGTLFSRRDSFITHRAFCDALAEESARAITSNNPLGLGGTSATASSSIQLHLQNHQLHGGGLPIFPLKREQDQLQLQLQQQQQQSFNNYLRPPELPPWLSTGPDPPTSQDLFSSPRLDHSMIHHHHENVNNTNPNPTLSSFQAAALASPHMSATALLQKATQMGVTMSKPSSCQSAAEEAETTTMLLRPHQAAHVSSTAGLMSSTSIILATSTAGSSSQLGLASREDQLGIGSGSGSGSGSTSTSFMHHHHHHHHGLMAYFGNKASDIISAGCMEQQQEQVGDLMSMVNSHHDGFEGSSRPFGGENFQGMLLNSSSRRDNSGSSSKEGGVLGIGGRGKNISDGLTRDFLGLKAFPPPREFLNLDDLHQIGGSPFNGQQNHHNPAAPW